jgi:GNAT superfamily N-acetyltransferase
MVHRPVLFKNKERLRFRRTPQSEYRIPYTFVDALNEGTLFDRSLRVFEEAARCERLYDVVAGADQRMVGVGMLQDTFKDADDRHREEELGCLMIHPAARGFGIAKLMIKLILVHRYAVQRRGRTEEDFIAHVVDGNAGPIHALLAAGFQVIGPVKLHPGEFDGAVEHMIAPGQNFVPMHAYKFNREAIENLVRELWTFWHGARILGSPDSSMELEADFSDLVDPSFLTTEMRRMGPERRST